MKTLYKSLPADKAPHGHEFRLGKWYKIEGKLAICGNGYHASRNIINAMRYVTPGWVAKVEVRGESEIQGNKECWSEMRIVEWHKWTKRDSVSLAIFAAELVLQNYEKEYPDDKRPREAIEAAKKVLKQDTAKNRAAAWAAARSAAWSAARSAAWSAESAARSAGSAARSAARSAAWSAESAAWSARSAARSAAWSAESAAWSAESAAWAAAKEKILQQCHDFVIKRKVKRI